MKNEVKMKYEDGHEDDPTHFFLNRPARMKLCTRTRVIQTDLVAFRPENAISFINLCNIRYYAVMIIDIVAFSVVYAYFTFVLV